MLKAAFSTLSLTIGETFVPVSVLLIPIIVYFAVRGILRTGKSAPDDLILVDSYNTGVYVQLHYLAVTGAPSPWSRGRASPVCVNSPKPGRAWFIHNLRDASPGGHTTRVQTAWCEGRQREDWKYLSYDKWQYWLLARS